MLDIPSISAIVAAIGVLVGVALTVLELRHLRKQRDTDLVVKLYSAFTSDDFLVSMLKVANLEFEDYRDFVKKYGSLLSETPINVAVYKIANYFDEVGTLLHRGVFDIDMVFEFLMIPTLTYWDKLKPLIEGFRKETGSRLGFSWFEYLYNEMKKREQKPQQTTVRGERTDL